MSAYFVTKETIDLIVSGILEFRSYVKTPGMAHAMDPISVNINPNAIGKMLWQECAASVCYRYDLAETDDPERSDELSGYAEEISKYKFKQYNCLKPGPLAKLIANYEYQSCEHRSWEQSDAFEACKNLTDELTRKLPGYEEAPWGADENNIAAFCEPTVVSLLSMMAR